MNEISWPEIYVAALCAGLLLVGVWHLMAGPMTERIFRQPQWVRLAGIALLLAALPCVLWPRPYFVVLGALLAVSGLLRALSPGVNIQLQKRTWPRWGHGCVISSFAILTWLAYQWVEKGDGLFVH